MITLDSSTDPLILIKSNRLLDCNKAAIQMFGYRHKEDLLAKSPEELLAGQQADGISAPQKLLYLWEQACEEGLYKDVLIARKGEGTYFVVDFQVISQRMNEGEILFYTKWLAKKELSKISPLPDFVLSEIVGSPVGLRLEISESGDVLYADRETEEWLGRNAGELSGPCNIVDLLSSVVVDTEAAKEKALPRWLSETRDAVNPYDVLVSFQHSLGTVLPAQVSVQFIGGSEVVGDDETGGSGMNEAVWRLKISPIKTPLPQEPVMADMKLELAGLRQENKNLKRLQKMLKKSLERFRVLAEYSPDVIVQFDRAHRHIFVNRQIEKHSDFKVEDYLGKTHAEVGFPTAYTRTCEQVLDAVFCSGESRRIELQQPNGVWMDWFLIPEFNGHGEVNTVITSSRDITRQKKLQLKLAKSERRLNDAFEVTKLSSWEYDFRTDSFRLSDNLIKLLEIEREGVRTLKGREYLDRFVVKEDYGKFRFIMEAARAARNEDFQEIIDYRVLKPDQELVHILASVRLELGDKGRVKRLYGTIQDITQLRLTEQELEEYRTSLERLVETRTQELKKSEAKLSDALRMANLGGWEFDPVLDAFILSHEALEILGTTAEIEGGNQFSIGRLKEVIHPDDFEIYRKTVYRTREMADEFYTEHTELRILRSDGDVRFIYLSISASKAGGRIKFYGTIQDISDMRRTEWEKNRLNTIIETTSDIVGIVRADGGITYLNKAGKDFFGIKCDEELCSRSLFDFQAHKAEKKPGSIDLLQADALGIWSSENQYLRHDGVEVPVSQVIISHKTPDGQVECYSTIIRDMSQQKRIEQDLIFKNNELDTFVYRASHDLRGPIATMMGLHNLVGYEIMDENALRMFDMYNSQVQRLNTITLTLIELTKIKQREFKPSRIDFKKMVRAVYRQVQHMTESQEMLLDQDVDEISDFVSDERLLNIILQNLVENSVKYKRKDTDSFVKVEIKHKEGTGRILIKVSDNGIGIDSGIQSKIFNMFFRGNERSGGSGLGLYMLKNAVEKLGGRVTLYSVLYKGTTFKIELPSLSDMEPA